MSSASFCCVPIELLCKIANYLNASELANYSTLCKLCHQASVAQHCIDFQLDATYSAIDLRRILSILKYHHFKHWTLPVSRTLSDPVIRRLLVTHFTPHRIAPSHAYLKNAYCTPTGSTSRIHSCVTSIALCGPSRLIARRNHEAPRDLLRLISKLQLRSLDIHTSRGLRLHQFVGCSSSLQRLVISTRNLLNERMHCLAFDCFSSFTHLQRLSIKNASLSDGIYEHDMELSLQLFILLSQWSPITASPDADVDKFDIDMQKMLFNRGIEVLSNPNDMYELLSPFASRWLVHIRHLSLHKQRIQTPLTLLLSLLAKFKYLRECCIEYCIFIDEYDSANQYAADSLHRFQTWMQPDVEEEEGELTASPWKRGLGVNLLRCLDQLSMTSKFQSATLQTLKMQGIHVSVDVLKLIALRFSNTLQKLEFRSCSLPCIQYDWKLLSTQCHALKQLIVENAVHSVHTRCCKHAGGYDLQGAVSPLNITYMSAQQNNRYLNLGLILQDIFNGADYYEAMQSLQMKHINRAIAEQLKRTAMQSVLYRKHLVDIQVKVGRNSMKAIEMPVSAPSIPKDMGPSRTACQYCGVLVLESDMMDHTQLQCLAAVIPCILCQTPIRRDGLAEHWLHGCAKYECICTVCLQVFGGREPLLAHYKQHDSIADIANQKYEFNWHTRVRAWDAVLFSPYPIGTLWVCARCSHRNMNVNVRMAKMRPFKLNENRGPKIAEICEVCKCPRFIDHVKFGWMLPTLDDSDKDRFADSKTDDDSLL